MKAETTAVILIGYQNDYFAKDGVLRPIIESDADQILQNTLNTLNALQDTKVLMVTTPILFTDDYRELVDPVGILAAVKESGAFKKGSAGGETIDELREFDDRIIEVPGKRGLNAFADTELEDVLRQHHIEDVVLAGVVTSICIDSTARAAHERGFRVHVLSDVTAGRTDMEQQFYCNEIFPLYANVIEHQTLVSNIGLSTP